MEGLSASLYWPFCSKWCYFCSYSTAVTSRKEHYEDYEQSVHQELSLLYQSYEFLKDSELKSFYLFGGSPDTLHLNCLRGFLERFQKAEDLFMVSEWDPRDFTSFPKFARNFHCFVVGVSHFDPAIQAHLNRIFQEDTLYSIMQQYPDKLWIFDILNKAPYETEESFEYNLGVLNSSSPHGIRLCPYIKTNTYEFYHGRKNQENLFDYSTSLESQGYRLEFRDVEDREYWVKMNMPETLVSKLRSTLSSKSEHLGLGLCNSSLLKEKRWQNTSVGELYRKSLRVDGRLPITKDVNSKK